MVAEYKRDDLRQRVLVTVRGPITFEDIVAVVRRQAAEGTWSYTMLYDEREATSTLTKDETRRLLAVIDTLRVEHGRRGRVALVFNTDATYGIGRMFSTLGDIMGMDTAVFRDVARAEAWLDGVR
jgi:hypothetical protein